MKKLLILILTLLMVFSLASCTGRCEKKGHKDKNTDGICDRCDAHIDGEHNVHTDSDANGYCDGCNALYISYGDNNVVGKILRKSLEKQFEEAKSMNITLEYESEIKNNSWDSYYDDDDSEISVPKEEASAYLEWSLWRAFLAIDTLKNKPYFIQTNIRTVIIRTLANILTI